MCSVIQCLMESPGASPGPNDHWSLRDYAAHVLAIIVEGWSFKLPYLKDFAVKSLQVWSSWALHIPKYPSNISS